MLGRVWGITRSMAMYHGIPGRQRRMRRRYAEFVSEGDLAFDIGAHVGNRVRAWRGLGAVVVAVEPQPDFVRVLRVLFGRDQRVVIDPRAVGAEPGTARMSISSATPTVSSLSPTWTHQVSGDRRFAKIRWDRSIEVEVVTLDQLVETYGVPAFCKIDVEGFEVDVLRGLSTPLPALSFEYLPAAHQHGQVALELLRALGDYEFNYSPIETMRFASVRWLDAEELAGLLDRYRPGGRSGDVYARLVTR